MLKRKQRNKIDKWINSEQGKRALQEAHDNSEKAVKELQESRKWSFEEWMRMLFTPYK
jgi:hypothetical protein